jgi:hypothetical protein
LKDSINLRFRADVPVGFNVSGDQVQKLGIMHKD